jgi:hypothetical protein
MKRSESAERRPKPAKRAWSAPVLEQIEMHSTGGADINRMKELTLEESLLAS